MKKNFETQLPGSYREALSVDFGEKKLGLWMNLAAGVVIVVIMIAAYFWIRPSF